MVFITGRYSTNHPKDVAARHVRDMRRTTQEQGCTHRELREPTERNIRKCMAEMKNTARDGEQYKKSAKFLGEDTNLNNFRRA